ncbi:MAG TPA: SEC-C metal-binding domain-containing protein [Terriglobales bacterium]|jgi:hypothetical protein|nr:SEC-C metal-binding domain-containing protein [Terriglobales bacterium]
MKHKFDGQNCVYCNDAPSETSDHALGRKFFLEERRGNLPQVPACRKCNNKKAEYEAYLMTVLPFGAKNVDAARILAELVPPRLEKNAKLRRTLTRGYDRSGGTSIPFHHKLLMGLFSMIAKALAFQHFNVRLGDGFSSTAAVFMDQASPAFQQMLSMGNRVGGDLGQGTFKYIGSQPGKYPEQTLWQLEIYGGIDFAGSNMPGGRASLAMAATGEKEFIRNLFYSTQMTDREIQKSTGRNDPCPCDSGKKHKKCHGSVEKQEARERMQAQARANQFPPSVYQPIAARGHDPGKLSK